MDQPLQEVFFDNEDIFNTMFSWTGSFSVYVFKRDGSVRTLKAPAELNRTLATPSIPTARRAHWQGAPIVRRPAPAPSTGAETCLRAGAAAVSITPEAGTRLQGYGITSQKVSMRRSSHQRWSSAPTRSTGC